MFIFNNGTGVTCIMNYQGAQQMADLSNSENEEFAGGLASIYLEIGESHKLMSPMLVPE